jgi:hypothetical protein
MAGVGFDVRLIGGTGLANMLAELPERSQNRVVKPALKRSCTRIHDYMIYNKLAGNPVHRRTGELALAMAGKFPTISTSRGWVRWGIKLPERHELGIQAYRKHEEGSVYWPIALEYGHRLVKKTKHGKRTIDFVMPRSFMRAAIDENADSEKRRLAHEIGKGIAAEAVRLAKKRGAAGRRLMRGQRKQMGFSRGALRAGKKALGVT